LRPWFSSFLNRASERVSRQRFDKLLQAQDQRIEQGLDGLADGISVVSLSETNRLAEQATQSDTFEEVLKQGDSAEEGQPDSIQSNAQISRAAAHD
jgi:hypothetical protein